MKNKKDKPVMMSDLIKHQERELKYLNWEKQNLDGYSYRQGQNDMFLKSLVAIILYYTLAHLMEFLLI